jgi:hypothetical protein
MWSTDILFQIKNAANAGFTEIKIKLGKNPNYGKAEGNKIIPVNFLLRIPTV